jgi:hypothetical protein
MEHSSWVESRATRCERNGSLRERVQSFIQLTGIIGDNDELNGGGDDGSEKHRAYSYTL